MQTTAASLPASWRILMTGITSIHGWPLWQALLARHPGDALCGLRPPRMRQPQGAQVVAGCVTDHALLKKLRDRFRPTHVIHAAGVCDLDVCEERPAWAHALNYRGTRAVVDTFGHCCQVLYLSTDLVFSGNNAPGAGYDESHRPDPVSVAGATFALAEEALADCAHGCIVRLGLPIGASITRRKGAIDWIESRLSRDRPVTLFHDEYRSCIDCRDIVEAVLEVLRRGVNGLFHLGGLRPWSLHDVGRQVVLAGGYPPGLLTAISRFEERNGPPRIGNVTLNSTRLRATLGLTPRCALPALAR